MADLNRAHQMMVDDGCPSFLLRRPGEKPSPPTSPAFPTKPAEDPKAVADRCYDDADLRREADGLWRGWTPSREHPTRPRKSTFLRMLREQRKETPMTKKIGPKEQQRRDLRERGSAASKKSAAKTSPGPATIEPAVTAKAEQKAPDPGVPQQEPTAMPEADNQESDMRKTTKTTKKTAAKKTAKAKARTAVKGATTSRPDGLREGSKQAVMLDMALRDEGATEAAICKKLGWKKCRVTLRRVADKVGAKLEPKKNVAGDVVWYATMKKAA